MRFIHKYRKWKGVDQETAKNAWDNYSRNPMIKRRYDAEDALLLAIPVMGTHSDLSGRKVSDKRSLEEATRFMAGDQEAISDARKGILALKRSFLS